MDDLELPSCPVCQEEYENGVVPMILGCGHTVCGNCLAQLLGQSGQAQYNQMACPTCRKTNNLVAPPKNYKLEEAISAIKKLQEIPKLPVNPNSVECTSCKKLECESDLFACRNCVKEVFNYDITGVIDPQIQLDIKSFAICGSCAIRKHVALGHDTVSYFPISAGFQFESHLTGVNIMKKELDQKVTVANDWYKEYKRTVARAFQEMDKMTEMMRKGKSSDVQREFAQRIEEECSKLATYVNSVANCIREGDENYLVGFNELVAKNLQDEVAKCQEMASKAADFACTVCSKRGSAEKMLCCRKCSEVVEALMSNQIDSSNFDAVDLNSLTVCMPCVFANHIGDNHKVVKFPEVQEKYSTADNMTRMSRKETELNQKFAVLARTFQQYITLVETYDTKISRMSKIAADSRGHPQHNTVLENLQFCLSEAETAMMALQAHAELDKNLLEVKDDDQVNNA